MWRGQAHWHDLNSGELVALSFQTATAFGAQSAEHEATNSKHWPSNVFPTPRRGDRSRDHHAQIFQSIAGPLDGASSEALGPVSPAWSFARAALWLTSMLARRNRLKSDRP